jgi:hypothetical protein
MSTTSAGRAPLARQEQRQGLLLRLSQETKHAFKTTEFWAMAAIGSH